MRGVLDALDYDQEDDCAKEIQEDEDPQGLKTLKGIKVPEKAYM
jgi:hypothetical protein